MPLTSDSGGGERVMLQEFCTHDLSHRAFAIAQRSAYQYTLSKPATKHPLYATCPTTVIVPVGRFRT